MSLFTRRLGGGPGPYLEWKVRLFAVAATLALGGMYLNKRWLVGVAIAVLAAGMALRFLPDEGAPDRGPGSEEGPEGAQDATEDEGKP